MSGPSVESLAKVYLGSDHAGFSLKRTLLPRLTAEFPQVHFEDLGCDSEASVDYPSYAEKVASGVVRTGGRGILICGSGVGMSIAANKVSGVRAGVVWDMTSARLSRQHNDANILCLGARLIGPEVAFDVCRVWLSTPFEGGRHQRRIDLIRSLETGKRS